MTLLVYLNPNRKGERFIWAAGQDPAETGYVYLYGKAPQGLRAQLLSRPVLMDQLLSSNTGFKLGYSPKDLQIVRDEKIRDGYDQIGQLNLVDFLAQTKLYELKDEDYRKVDDISDILSRPPLVVDVNAYFRMNPGKRLHIQPFFRGMEIPALPKRGKSEIWEF